MSSHAMDLLSMQNFLLQDEDENFYFYKHFRIGINCYFIHCFGWLLALSFIVCYYYYYYYCTLVTVFTA